MEQYTRDDALQDTMNYVYQHDCDNVCVVAYGRSQRALMCCLLVSSILKWNDTRSGTTGNRLPVDLQSTGA